MTGIVELPQAANYVELDWYDENEVVQVRPRDKQRFEVQKDRAIEILRVAKEGDRFQTHFQFLLNTLAACQGENASTAERIRRCARVLS